jgi:hypothetical protein
MAMSHSQPSAGKVLQPRVVVKLIQGLRVDSSKRYPAIWFVVSFSFLRVRRCRTFPQPTFSAADFPFPQMIEGQKLVFKPLYLSF